MSAASTGQRPPRAAGPTEQPDRARRHNRVNQLERAALMQPDAPALCFRGETSTWVEVGHPGALEIVDALPRIRSGKILQIEPRSRYSAPTGTEIHTAPMGSINASRT